MQRILTNGNTPSQETRIALLSRLATTSPPSDGIGDEILQHFLKAYHTDHGHELAVTWLFSLYKQQTGGHQGTGKGAGELAQAGAQEGSSQAKSGTGVSVKAEEGAVAASHVTTAEEQEEKEEGRQGVTALEVDDLGGKCRALCIAEGCCCLVMVRHTKASQLFCREQHYIATRCEADLLECEDKTSGQLLTSDISQVTTV